MCQTFAEISGTCVSADRRVGDVAGYVNTCDNEHVLLYAGESWNVNEHIRKVCKIGVLNVTPAKIPGLGSGQGLLKFGLRLRFGVLCFFETYLVPDLRGWETCERRLNSSGVLLLLLDITCTRFTWLGNV